VVGLICNLCDRFVPAHMDICLRRDDKINSARHPSNGADTILTRDTNTPALAPRAEGPPHLPALIL
jgi:hypothetical protein